MTSGSGTTSDNARYNPENGYCVSCSSSHSADAFVAGADRTARERGVIGSTGGGGGGGRCVSTQFEGAGAPAKRWYGKGGAANGIEGRQDTNEDSAGNNRKPLVPKTDAKGKECTNYERQELARKSGVCTRCFEVRTHSVRRRAFFFRRMHPIKGGEKDGNGDVYKGICIPCNKTSGLLPSKVVDGWKERNPNGLVRLTSNSNNNINNNNNNAGNGSVPPEQNTLGIVVPERQDDIHLSVDGAVPITSDRCVTYNNQQQEQQRHRTHEGFRNQNANRVSGQYQVEVVPTYTIRDGPNFRHTTQTTQPTEEFASKTMPAGSAAMTPFEAAGLAKFKILATASIKINVSIQGGDSSNSSGSCGTPCTSQGEEKEIQLVALAGSVLDFESDDGCIVNATNNGGISGHGLDGMVNRAGGYEMEETRRHLGGIPTGTAKSTPSFHHTKVQHVIHTCGPVLRNNSQSKDTTRLEDKYRQLTSAYRSSLEEARRLRCRDIAFSLLSAGVFRGQTPLETVIRLGLDGIVEFYERCYSPPFGDMDRDDDDLVEAVLPSRVFVVAYTPKEQAALADEFGRFVRM